MGIEDALNTFSFGDGAGWGCWGSSAVRVMSAHDGLATETVITFSLLVFRCSPARVRAVGVGGALSAATTLDITEWEAVIKAVFVLGTEVDADSGKGVAVRLFFLLTTIKFTTLLTSLLGAIVASTISSAVGS